MINLAFHNIRIAWRNLMKRRGRRRKKFFYTRKNVSFPMEDFHFKL